MKKVKNKNNENGLTYFILQATLIIAIKLANHKSQKLTNQEAFPQKLTNKSWQKKGQC